MGSVNVTFGDTAMVATCAHGHGKCKLLLTHKPALGIDLGTVHCDVLLWLAAGSSMTPEEHQELSATLRRDVYKMRLRR